jgi:hypothetical protein
VFSFAGFLVLVALLYLWENWRGNQAWNVLKSEWSAKGEPFEIALIKPPAVPDAENFASTPLFAPLLDYALDPAGKTNRWRDEAGRKRAASISPFGTSEPKSRPAWHQQEPMDLALLQAHYQTQKDFPQPEKPGRPGADILKALSRYDDVITELRRVAARPYSRFPVHYEENFSCLLPHLAVLKNLARITELQALAHLDLGQPDAALADVKLGLRIADALRDEPLLISQLVRISATGLNLQPIWEGMARSQWGPAHLKELEASLRSIRILASLRPCLRGERVIATETLDLMRRDVRLVNLMGADSSSSEDEWWRHWGFRVMPDGWFQFNKVTLSRMHLEFMHTLVDDQGTRAFPDRAAALDAVMQAELKPFSVHRFLASLLFPAISNAGQKFAAHQGGIDLAIAACVLEQYKLDQGRYPETLEALPAAVRDRIPLDLISGKPLRYARQGDRFMLYSVGWNQSDDGGKIGLTEGSNPRWDSKKGDWLWAYPQG